MSRVTLSNIVEKLQIWAITGMLGVIVFFGRDVYSNVKETHDLALILKTKQENIEATIQRHENMLTELKKQK